jgi:hypothetical protein
VKSAVIIGRKRARNILDASLKDLKVGLLVKPKKMIIFTKVKIKA